MLPIFQMIIDFDGNNSFGLKFSTETDSFVPPVFTIPRQPNLYGNTFYMPGEIHGEYVNFLAKFNEQQYALVIDDIRLGNPVKFQIPYPDYYTMKMPYFPTDNLHPFFSLKYTGNDTKTVKHYQDFIILSPLDLLVMDSLYVEKKACFVGLTPVYGNEEQ
jgi:hypothetical protein